MVRRLEHFFLWPLFDDTSTLHDHDLVSNRADRCQVMRDEHIGQIQLLLQPVEQPEDAFGDKLIERARHLIANDEFRLRRQCASDTNPLLLTAR